METKKISFGFMKTKKQDKPILVEKKDYIECVEEKSIKVVGGEVEEKAPLVIQMKPNTLITAERLKQIAAQVENFEDEKPEVNNVETKTPENETLEEMAARELLEEAKKKEVVETPNLVVPIPALPVLEGKKESTLDDYESIPIQDFGMAMLRGMGWTPGKELSKYKQPQLRPKGLGLGADKVIKENQKKSTKENEEDLTIIKKAYVKITTGKFAGFYGQVVSLDEDNGRAMVDIPIKKETVSLSEFMMQPVSKSEYDRQSKVINADSYEEYKRKENNPNSCTNSEKESKQRYGNDRKDEKSIRREDRPSKIINNDSFDSDSERSPTRARNNDKSRDKRDRYDSDTRKKSRKYSSSESLTSESDRRRHSPHRDKLRKEKKIKHSKDRYKDVDKRRNKSKYSSESLGSESDHKSRSSSSEPRRHKKSSKSSKEKKDIDKKRKGKKKKRDRDRSPNYKKYRK